MTIQDQIDQLKKELSEIAGQLNNKIVTIQRQIDDPMKKVRDINVPKFVGDTGITRYYPNGAHMDEPEENTVVWVLSGSMCVEGFYGGKNLR